jgi:phosphate butyryltransferase
MPLDSFDQLHRDADQRKTPVPLAVAGGDDPTVLEAVRIACDKGWIAPILVGPESHIRELAGSINVDLTDFTIVDVHGDSIAPSAVSLVTTGAAAALMKGQIPTPALMKAVQHPGTGLRTGRVICQVVLMEVPRDRRRFLLADTGISVQPTLDERIDIMRSSIEVANVLGEPSPKIAVMAATETVKSSMPETLDAAELVHRHLQASLGSCVIEGPLSFDLAYATDAGARKRIEGSVVGAADIMLFPNLLSANLTVKAIMYTADCKFGGMLRGTSAPVVFMSRADSTDVRLNSLALTLRVLDQEQTSAPK